jgi:hypothetical protein
MTFTVGKIPVSGISSKQVTLVASNVITATATGTGTLIGLDCFSIADLQLLISAASGTSPTLDVYVQKLLPDGTTYDDLIHFTQATAAASYVATAVVGNQAVHTAATRSLGAGLVRSSTFGNTWRIDAVVGGTNPSFTFALYGDFYV